MKKTFLSLCFITALSPSAMRPQDLQEAEVIERARALVPSLVGWCSYTFTNRCDADAGLGTHNIGYINPQMEIFVTTVVPALKTSMNELFLVASDATLGLARGIPMAFKTEAEKTPLVYKGYDWRDKKDRIYEALRTHLEGLEQTHQASRAEEDRLQRERETERARLQALEEREGNVPLQALAVARRQLGDMLLREAGAAL